MRTSSIPCNRRPREDTWRNHVVGFYFNKTWISIVCKETNLPYNNITFKKFGKCLKNRQIILIGDSNVKTFYKIFVNLFNMTQTSRYFFFLFATNTEMNVSVSQSHHHVPHLTAGFQDKLSYLPATKWFDDIPAGNNSIIMLHLWMHAKMMDFGVFRRHVRQIRISAERMLQRAPKVDLIIKGPHACTGQIPPTDWAVQQHKAIWREEFQGIQEKVIFIDLWGMTIGTENKRTHPYNVMDMVYHFLSHLCRVRS